MALTNESSNVATEYNYDAYGNIVSKSGSMALANVTNKLKIPDGRVDLGKFYQKISRDGPPT